MARPRWRKLGRDACREKGRIVVMVVAVAASLVAFGTILASYAVLTREISRSYLDSNPASATLVLDSVDSSLLDEVRRFPDIAASEARALVVARVKVGPDWKPLLLFVVDDFRSLRLNTLIPLQGNWPPPEGTLLIEQTALGECGARLGQKVTVKAPHGRSLDMRVSGIVHDPGLAPAWQERVGYAYLTRSSLALLGEAPVLDLLRIQVADSQFDPQHIETVARGLAKTIAGRGRQVREIQLPAPGKHPHQHHMNTLLAVLMAFSVLALVLSALIVAASFSAMLSRQVREVAIMKLVGARTGQIVALYAVLALALGGAVVALALPTSALAGRSLAATLAEVLNLSVASRAIPVWVFVSQAAAGALLLLLVTGVPILRASRVTVRRSLDDYGVHGDAFGERRLDRWLGALQGPSRTTTLALRNMFRRRGRLALIVTLLAAGGAMFMSARNLSAGAQRLIEQMFAASRQYDHEVRLNFPQPVEPLIHRLQSLPGTLCVEAWGYSSAAFARQGEIDLVHTYPDGGHGSFSVLAPPASTRLVQLPLVAGRWLRSGDTDAVVLNQAVLKMAPHPLNLGDRVLLSIDGRPTSWRIVGVVKEFGGTAYVTNTAFAEATGTKGSARMLRIVTAGQNPDEREALIRDQVRVLEDVGASIQTSAPMAEMERGIVNHFAILIGTLVAVGFVIAAIAAYGLGAAMSMSVIERTRELGVMQAVGAGPGILLRLLMLEGVFTGALSCGVAVALAVPLTLFLGGLVGRMAFGAALPFMISPWAIAQWAVLVVVVSMAATAYPAWRASKLTVREALAFV